MTEPHIVRVPLGERAYDIVIGPGLIETAGERLTPEEYLRELCEQGLAERYPAKPQAAIDRLEQTLELLVGQRQVKEQYCTAEVAEILGKAEFTVREWCRLGRVRARKRRCGRGPAGEWTIAHDELVRIQNHGLLPGAGY